MHLNTDEVPPKAPERKPCWRDYSILKRDFLPDVLVKLVPMDELLRRAAELERTHPQFKEELPLVLSGEARRRAIEGGHLTMSGRDVLFSEPASTASYA